MVTNVKTLDELRNIGLNKYERNLWTSLLSRGSAAAGELSDISNVPRSRCYDVLSGLAEKGLVMVQPGKPLKYAAIQPKEALERLKKKIQERADEMSDKIDKLSKGNTIKELEKLHKTSIKTLQPEDLTGAIKGRNALNTHVRTMLKKAGKSVKLITTESGLFDLYDNHLSLIKKISSNGIKLQLIVPVTQKNQMIANILSKHIQIKDLQNTELLKKIAGRLCIIDNQEFIIGLTDDTKIHPTQDVSMWTQSNHVVSNFLEPVFDMVWNNSKQIDN